MLNTTALPQPRLLRRRSRITALGACLLVAGLVGPVGAASAQGSPAAPYRAFSASSWWNTALPTAPPTNSNEAGILNYLRTGPDNGGGFLRLAGAGDNAWGQPVFWAGAGDREYSVRWSSSLRQPELDHLRIPDQMQAAQTSDGALTLFDVPRGYVVAMTRAKYNSATDVWSVGGATVTYLASNGLDARVTGSDDARNGGSHRGNNGATMMARLDEVQAGVIPHVLKVACGPEANTQAVFPMNRSDGNSATSPVKQGLRLRIRPELDLNALGLPAEALVLAQAAQTYGVYCGDSGPNTALKLENTVIEGRGQLWTTPADALSGLPFTTAFWDVLPEGYR